MIDFSDDILNPFLEEKFEELNTTIANLKADHKKELEKKDHIIADLEAQTSKTKRVGTDSLDSNDFVSTSIINLEEELQKKDATIVDMKRQLKEEKTVVNKMKQFIEELKLEKADVAKVSLSKDRAIDSLQTDKVFLENRITDLQKQVENKDIELRNLEEEKESLKSNMQSKKSESESTLGSDTSCVENTRQYLFLLLKEKDEKILRMKHKIKHLKDLNNQMSVKIDSGAQRTSTSQFDSLNNAVDKINRVTRNNFESLDECIHFVQILFEDSQKKMKNDFNREDFYPSDSGYSSNQQRMFNKDIDDLNERIYDLELKLKSDEKRYRNKLQEKDEEIEELQEEISNAKSTKTKDLRNKARIKQFEERIDELETQLESKSDEMALKEKKMKETLQDLNFTKSENVRLNEQCGKLQREIKQLKEEELKLKTNYEDELNDIQEILGQKDREIANKQNIIGTIELKLKEQEDEMAEDYKKIFDDLVICKQDLATEKENNERLNTVSDRQRDKIGLLEEKISNFEKELDKYRINKFQAKDHAFVDPMDKPEQNWQPRWWANHMAMDDEKPSQKNLMVDCPKCGEKQHVRQIKQHLKNCY